MEIQILLYRTAQGREPYTQWLESIRDTVTQDRIESRVDRMTRGNFGDHHGVGEGVLELRLHFGLGYRVYFGVVDETRVLLLCGGDKSTQDKDIPHAKRFWRQHKEQNE